MWLRQNASNLHGDIMRHVDPGLRHANSPIEDFYQGGIA
jgi:hypothetical protein